MWLFGYSIILDIFAICKKENVIQFSSFDIIWYFLLHANNLFHIQAVFLFCFVFFQSELSF